MYSCGGLAFLATGSKLTNHGFNCPMKWRIFTLSPNLNGAEPKKRKKEDKRRHLFQLKLSWADGGWLTVWMREDMNSMPLSMYYKRMAIVLMNPMMPNRQSIYSINLDHRHQSYPFGRQIVLAFQRYRHLDDRQKRRSWNNLASRHLGRLTILRDRIARHSFAKPAEEKEKKNNQKWRNDKFLELESVGWPGACYRCKTYECISIKEYTFFILGQIPAMQFCECNA